MRSVVLVAALGIGVIGCSGGSGSNPGSGSGSGSGSDPNIESKDIPVAINRDVDILFMIDDSPSMADKQNNLATNFPRFVATLQALPGGLPNVHIGVVTSDLGTRSAKDGTTAPGIGTLGQGGCAGLGKAGTLQTFGAPVMGGMYISDTADPTDPTGATRTRNYTGNLADVFAQMAKAGAGGCGFEQPLEAVKLALNPTNTVNAGFLRSDAHLAIVLLTDEDDCSLLDASLIDPSNTQLGALESFRCTQYGITCDDGGATPADMAKTGGKQSCHTNDQSTYLTNVADYATYFKALKNDPDKVLVAAIAGDPTPVATVLQAPPGSQTQIPALAHSCMYNGADGLEVADPAVRIQDLLDQFPGHSTQASICQQDLSGGAAQVADLIRQSIGDPCIEHVLADVDPNTPGAQYSCTVQVAIDTGLPTEIKTDVPACDATQSVQPCWQLLNDPQECATTPTHEKLDITGQSQLSPAAHILAQCQIAVTAQP